MKKIDPTQNDQIGGIKHSYSNEVQGQLEFSSTEDTMPILKVTINGERKIGMDYVPVKATFMFLNRTMALNEFPNILTLEGQIFPVNTVQTLSVRFGDGLMLVQPRVVSLTCTPKAKTK